MDGLRASQLEEQLKSIESELRANLFNIERWRQFHFQRWIVIFKSVYEHDSRECLGIGQSCLWAELRIPCTEYAAIKAYLPATQQLRQFLASKNDNDSLNISGVFLQKYSILDGAKTVTSPEGLMYSILTLQFEAKVVQAY